MTALLPGDLFSARAEGGLQRSSSNPRTLQSSPAERQCLHTTNIGVKAGVWVNLISFTLGCIFIYYCINMSYCTCVYCSWELDGKRKAKLCGLYQYLASCTAFILTDCHFRSRAHYVPIFVRTVSHTHLLFKFVTCSLRDAAFFNIHWPQPNKFIKFCAFRLSHIFTSFVLPFLFFFYFFLLWKCLQHGAFLCVYPVKK